LLALHLRGEQTSALRQVYFYKRLGVISYSQLPSTFVNVVTVARSATADSTETSGN
jgi:hypothetical protein